MAERITSAGAAARGVNFVHGKRHSGEAAYRTSPVLRSKSCRCRCRRPRPGARTSRRDVLGRLERAGSSPGKALARMPVRVGPGIHEVGAHGRVLDLVRVGLDQRLEPRLGDGVGTPVGRAADAAPEDTKMARPASERRSSGSSVRIRRQLAVRLTSITSPQASAVTCPEATAAPGCRRCRRGCRACPSAGRWWGRAHRSCRGS